MAEVVQHQRGLDVGQAHDGADHGLVAGGEHERRRKAEELGEALLQLHVSGGGGLRTRAREPHCVLVDGRSGSLLDLGMRGQAQIVVGAELHDRLAGDRGAQTTVLELAEERVNLLFFRLTNARQLVCAFSSIQLAPGLSSSRSPPTRCRSTRAR